MKRTMLACLLVSGMAAGAFAQKTRLRIGLGTSVVTPHLDQPMAGYYYPRMAEGVHDDLYAKALIFDNGRDRIVLVATDTIGVSKPIVDEVRRRIEKRLSIPPDHIMISATHCHTGPKLTPAYEKELAHRITDAILSAHGKAQPARLFVTTEREPAIAHYRRYFMKDGTVRTNPGFLNPDVVRPAGKADPRVAILYAETGDGVPLMTWVNFGMHLDTVGGTWISADYPYYMGKVLARVKSPDMLTIFTLGAAGNINHWDVRRPGPQRGNDESRRLGEMLAGDVIKAYTHLEPVSSESMQTGSARVSLPVPAVTEKELAAAKEIVAQPPAPGVDFTLDRVRAEKIVAVAERRGKPVSAEVQVLALGPVAFVGIPGELFVELSRRIQKNSPYPYTFVVTLANDTIGYIPTREAFRQGGYEPTSATFAPGGGEQLVEKAIELLRSGR